MTYNCCVGSLSTERYFTITDYQGWGKCSKIDVEGEGGDRCCCYYSEEVGGKHFEEWIALSNLNNDLMKVLDVIRSEQERLASEV
jgi:hypothetical protein